MNDGMLPVSRVLKIPMLHRVDVNIVHVVGEILIIANQILPEKALPDATFSLRDALTFSQHGVNATTDVGQMKRAQPTGRIKSARTSPANLHAIHCLPSL